MTREAKQKKRQNLTGLQAWEPDRRLTGGRAPSRLDVAEEIELIGRAQAGDMAARHRLIEAHYGLVLYLAASFQCRSFERDDVIQEGLLGMMRALEGFDTSRGCRFATYATYWIRQAIQRAIDRTGRLIGIPVDLAHAARGVEAAREAFIQENGFPPGLQELSKLSGVSCRRLAGLLTCMAEPLSLDTLRDTAEEAPHELPDPASPDPQAAALQSCDRAELRRWLEILPAEDRTVLEGRYGLGGGELSDDEFLERHGLDRAAVRRIERRALRRLRTHFHRREITSLAFT
jgi:RNA polymerase sigma factor (sigma-70 family)